jgi:hypothetical protein
MCVVLSGGGVIRNVAEFRGQIWEFTGQKLSYHRSTFLPFFPPSFLKLIAVLSQFSILNSQDPPCCSEIISLINLCFSLQYSVNPAVMAVVWPMMENDVTINLIDQATSGLMNAVTQKARYQLTVTIANYLSDVSALLTLQLLWLALLGNCVQGFCWVLVATLTTLEISSQRQHCDTFEI